MGGWVDREQHGLATLRARLGDPLRAIDAHTERVHRLQADLRGAVLRGLDRRAVELEHARARLTALGPAATLARGYAIVQRVTDDPVLPVLRSAAEVGPAATGCASAWPTGWSELRWTVSELDERGSQAPGGGGG